MGTKDIQSFDDMAAGLSDGSILMAMGNSDVPVGHTQKILRYYGLDEDALAPPAFSATAPM